MTDITTPVPAGTDIGKLIGGYLVGLVNLVDTAGAEVLGQATASPAANTIGDRLKTLATLFGRTTSATDIVAVAPSDTVTLAVTAKALMVTVAGNLSTKGASGVAITYPVTVGQLIPVQPTYVLATGTTASVVALV